MLQHIKPDRVELGMFVHGFVGSWFDHPFWRKKFLLEDEDDLVVNVVRTVSHSEYIVSIARQVEAV